MYTRVHRAHAGLDRHGLWQKGGGCQAGAAGRGAVPSQGMLLGLLCCMRIITPLGEKLGWGGGMAKRGEGADLGEALEEAAAAAAEGEDVQGQVGAGAGAGQEGAWRQWRDGSLLCCFLVPVTL